MSTKTKALQALARSFDDRPGILDGDLRVEELRTGLVETIGDEELRIALTDIDGGDGGERKWHVRADGSLQRPKLHSAYSSCGLALNSFGPWRLDPSNLVVNSHAGFEALALERQLPIFRGGRAPSLDVFLTAPGRALVIESKLTEHLAKKPPAKFSDAYDRLEGTTDPSWWAVYQRLRREPSAFKYLDAAQLIKHYFGLKAFRTKQGINEATLLYLYWEPEDADRYSELAEHASEVEDLARVVSDSAISFEALSYPDLWAQWNELDQPAWLRDHVAALRQKYAVRLA